MGNNKKKSNLNKKNEKFSFKKTSDSENKEISQLQQKYASIEPKNIQFFSDFPLSRHTQKGLKRSNYNKPTEIQKQSIGYALQGRDVLGAAITGSGKTLCFLIPVLENLFTKKWSRHDGVGAVIISPTRELAYQIFETLKKIGSDHEISAGLIIGGKNLKFERTRMDQCNIVICTPGRLLQHMDENPLFNCDSLQVLVLDEADRCLDLGFEQTMNSIIDNLPTDRQTLLFSATQTKSVKDLARLSLKDPVYVAPHEQSVHSTPDSLKQNYVVVELEDKITMLWSFIKNHLKQKSIVFMASCKQVKYAYEIFCKLRPGVTVLALYGTLHQMRRMAIYDEFCRKSNAVLFATDIASRGLDFPVVNWVIQLDCPEDATAYIHRAGRTARHTAVGESLLVLLPSEEKAMIEELQERKIPINKIHIDPKKMFSPKAKIEAFLAQNQELKQSAQRAFVAYIKSVVLMKNKNIFNVDALNTDAFARSLGLINSPRIRFLQRMRKNQKQSQEDSNEEEDNERSQESDSNSDSDSNSADEKTHIVNTNSKKDDINFNAAFSSDDDDDDDENDDFIKIKRRDHEILDEELPEVAPLETIKSSKQKQKPVTKAALAKRLLKKKILPNTKVLFDEDGSTIDPLNKFKSNLAKEYEESDENGINIEKVKQLIKEEDKFDKERFKMLVKAKHKEKKNKLKERTAGDEPQEQDDFGSDDEDGAGPDLSWLPDPNKVFGNKNKTNDSDDDSDTYVGREVVNSSDESYSDDDGPSAAFDDTDDEDVKTDFQVQNGKRKQNSNEAPASKKIKTVTSNLSLDEAELFAMKLLQK